MSANHHTGGIAISSHLHPFDNPFPPKLVTLYPCGHIAAPFMQEELQDPEQLWVKLLGNDSNHKESCGLSFPSSPSPPLVPSFLPCRRNTKTLRSCG
jgi:hypothetical protein